MKFDDKLTDKQKQTLLDKWDMKLITVFDPADDALVDMLDTALDEQLPVCWVAEDEDGEYMFNVFETCDRYFNEHDSNELRTMFEKLSCLYFLANDSKEFGSVRFKLWSVCFNPSNSTHAFIRVETI